jgi:hypothetical protein
VSFWDPSFAAIRGVCLITPVAFCCGFLGGEVDGGVDR